MRISCWQCGETLERLGVGRVGKREPCAKCDADLHCCRNCRFFDPSVHNQCRETQAEWVKEKDRANYCDYLDPTEAVGPPRRSSSSSSDIKKKFDDLFKV
ncbi:MAG: hypothetical protein O7F56_00300 [Acidobacteria bacterium]|nr:hypothetical protein [Acidobacteriota bacterium]